MGLIPNITSIATTSFISIQCQERSTHCPLGAKTEGGQGLFVKTSTRSLIACECNNQFAASTGLKRRITKIILYKILRSDNYKFMLNAKTLYCFHF